MGGAKRKWAVLSIHEDLTHTKRKRKRKSRRRRRRKREGKGVKLRG